MTRAAFLLVLIGPAVWAGGVRVLFNSATPAVGPFPSDALTVADSRQKTGRRVNMPQDNFGIGRQLNNLDGFNLNPRLRVSFSADIQPETLKDGLALVALENLTGEEYGLHREGDRIPVNQVIYDPATRTAAAKPDGVLDQHRRYALVITTAVRDRAGDPVERDAAFSACIGDGEGNYCAALAKAVETAGGAAVAGASVFTTMSATTWLERAREAVSSPPSSFRRAGPRAVFRVSDVAALAWRRQVRTNPAGFDDLSLPPSLLTGVGHIAFGSFQSRDFRDASGRIADQPTGPDSPLLVPAQTGEVFFHALLPAGQKPAAGYPVVIFGHGLTDSRFGGPTAVARTVAGAGFAVVAINAVGHGYGAESKVVLRDRAGTEYELPGGGRGVDINGDGRIDAEEGCLVFDPAVPVGPRDCVRQTALDLSALVAAIRAGVDFDDDRSPELDPARIYYIGQSLGAIYGTVFGAVEPEVRALALNAGGGAVIDVVRWSPSFRENARRLIPPPLLNQGAEFNENYVLRDRPVKINDVPGALDLQDLFEALEWLQASGDPLSYAPHLRASTLPGVGIRNVLWQFALGDRTVPNPASSALVRAANMRESTWLYRHDLTRRVLPGLDPDPHIYLADILSLQSLPIALAAQRQIAEFFAADGQAIADPNDAVRALFGRDIFEVPENLPEDLNF